MSEELKGQVVLITGGGRGLGKIMALGLAARGAAIALIARSKAQIDAVAGEITQAGGRAFATVADVTDRAQVDAAVEATEQALGRIDVLIDNAGIDEPFGPIGIVDPDAWWRTHSVHVKGSLYFMSAVLPGMRARKAGRIINITSLAGNFVIRNMSAYAVAKSTLTRLTQHVAEESKEDGIAAFAIEPGTIFTTMAENTLNSPDAQKWIPEGLAFLSSITPEQSEASKVRLLEMVGQLASGRYNGLSGRYLEPGDDFDALLAETNTDTQVFEGKV